MCAKLCTVHACLRAGMRACLFQSVRKLVGGEKKMTDNGQELMVKGGRETGGRIETVWKTGMVRFRMIDKGRIFRTKTNGQSTVSEVL